MRPDAFWCAPFDNSSLKTENNLRSLTLIQISEIANLPLLTTWIRVPLLQVMVQTPFLSLFQHVLSRDPKMSYTEEGHCCGEPHPNLPGPQRMQWDIPAEVRPLISTSKQVAMATCLALNHWLHWELAWSILERESIGWL